jgi:O-antigen ligase
MAPVTEPIPGAPSQSLLDQFRANTTRPKLHPAEKLVLGVVATHLVFLPWALGTMHVWSQGTSFCLAILGFGIALRPRRHLSRDGGFDEPLDQLGALSLSKRLTTGATPRRIGIQRSFQNLIRFPLFWLGLAFLVYVLIQALNPAWEYQLAGGYWWLQKIDCVRWLPAGMRAPFAISNPWRSLMIYTDAWLLVNTLWVGFTRRRSLQILFTVLGCNAFALAIFGLAQKALHLELIFGFWKPPASYFVSSFIYKNHAGAYFNLLLCLTIGLFFWYSYRSQRHLDKSSPGSVFAFFSLAITAIIFFSASRTATLLMGVIVLSVAVYYFLKKRQNKADLMDNLPIWFPLGCVILFGFVAIYSLDTGTIIDRLYEAAETAEVDGTGIREVVSRATLEMAKDNLACGWGAGCYRYYFPVYQVRYPELERDDGRGHKLFWEHAHNDYVETLAEVGLVGLSLAALWLGCAAWLMIRARVWENSLALFATLGLVITAVHSTVDFNFQNPAIMLTWCALVPAIILWAERDKRN